MKIFAKLSIGSIQSARDEIHIYKDSLDGKIRQFVEELAEYGISIAEQNTGEWGKHIEFIKQVTETQTGCKAIMIMRDREQIIPPHDSRPVSPSMMAEYGAGHFAVNGWQGTFPEQQHAFDPKGWWYLGKDDKWHHSYGIHPKRPMYTAYQDMLNHINEVAKRVFA